MGFPNRTPKTLDMGSIASAAVFSVAAVDTTDMYEFDRFVTVTGTFVGTVKIEISNDGTTWAQDGADITTPKAQAVTGRAKYTRCRCSAYTSGTPAATLYGVRSMNG